MRRGLGLVAALGSVALGSLGCPAPSPIDAGPEPLDAGGTLSGSHAFAVLSAGSFFRTTSDGGADLTRPTVLLTSADIGCQSPFVPMTQPARALMMQRVLRDGGPAEGQHEVGGPGIDLQLVTAPGDGGLPTALTSRPSGHFVCVTVTPLGVTGTLEVATEDGGTLSGSFSAPYCGLL